MSERGKDPLDIILSMGRVSTQGPFYKVELEFTSGEDAGKIVEIVAPVYRVDQGDRYMIVETRLDLATGETEKIPTLAVYSPKGEVMTEETVIRAVRRSRKARGTRRTGLGHV